MSEDLRPEDGETSQGSRPLSDFYVLPEGTGESSSEPWIVEGPPAPPPMAQALPVAPPPKRSRPWTTVAVVVIVLFLGFQVFKFVGSIDGSDGTGGDRGKLLERSQKLAALSTSCATDAGSTCYHLRFAWDFKGRSWTWEPMIPKTVYDYYVGKARPSNSLRFQEMVADTTDDVLLSEVAQQLRTTASSEGYSEYDTVSFALSFVQSLRYTTDQVSAAQDEYARYPIETLVFEGGDCEDVSILGAALVSALGYGAALLIFDKIPGTDSGHAALGVAGTDLVGTYFERDGTRYYYAEMTHSGYSLGQLPDMVQGLDAYIFPVAAPVAKATAPPASIEPASTQPATTPGGDTGSRRQTLVSNEQVAVEAGGVLWYSVQLYRSARIDYAYHVVDGSTEDVGIIRSADRAAYLDGQPVSGWAVHKGVQSADDGASLTEGNYDVVFRCLNQVADCDFVYSVSLTA